MSLAEQLLSRGKELDLGPEFQVMFQAAKCHPNPFDRKTHFAKVGLYIDQTKSWCDELAGGRFGHKVADHCTRYKVRPPDTKFRYAPPTTEPGRLSPRLFSEHT